MWQTILFCSFILWWSVVGESRGAEVARRWDKIGYSVFGRLLFLLFLQSERQRTKWKHTQRENEQAIGILGWETKEYLPLTGNGNSAWVHSLHTLLRSWRRNVGIENQIVVIDRGYNNIFLGILVFTKMIRSQYQNFPSVCIASASSCRVGKQVVTFSFFISIFPISLQQVLFLWFSVRMGACKEWDYVLQCAAVTAFGKEGLAFIAISLRMAQAHL